ncbi:MAG TPA: ABC transporter substrate-binding protein [Alphaproteobacteria bacterium]
MTQRFVLGVSAAFAALAAHSAAAQTTVKVGWCAKTVTSAAAPYAVATKFGWYAADKIKVELSPLPGSTDCVKLVATGDIPYSVPSVEPLAILAPQGIKMKVFYTAYQGNIYGIDVPAESPVKTFKDLKGKKIGVASMASGGVIIARAIAATNGMNPDSDVNIVVSGEGAQAAALVRSKQVDALSLYDTQYALVENAGMKLRPLADANKEISRYPSNGFAALDSTLKNKREQSVAVARGYARGTVWTMANPEAAIRILYEVFPQTKSLGKDDATAMKEDLKTLAARAENWKLEKADVKRWGESNEANYAAYVDFMLKWGIIKEKVAASDLITNDLIDDINKFDAVQTIADAKAYKAR